MLARREAELVLRETRFMNQALLRDFPDRTLEAIKGKRKQAAYRKLVQKFVEGMAADLDGDVIPDIVDYDAGDYRSAIADYIVALPVPENSDFKAPRLVQICNSISRKSETEIFDELSAYLAEIFPAVRRGPKATPGTETSNLSKKQARKIEYARTQDLWRKNRNKCIRMIRERPV